MLRSDDLEEVLRQAQEVAAETDQELNSAHLLLAVYTVDNHAKMLLEDLRFDEDMVIAKVLDLRQRINGILTEPEGVSKRIHERIDEVAKGCKSRRANSLHMLVAIIGVKDSLAYAILNRTRGPIRELRTTALSYLTDGLPRRYARAPVFTMPKPSLLPTKPRKRRASDAEAEPEPAPDADVETPAPPARKRAGHKRPAARKPGRGRPAAIPGGLNPGEFPTLAELGRDLTALAESGGLDPLVGRTREVEEICDVLGKRRSNNPLLLGAPGVGKTAIVEGLARKQIDSPEQVGALAGKRLIAVDLAAVASSGGSRGGIAERLRAIREEVQAAEGRIVIFIDEIHQLAALNRGGGDPAADLKGALARGELPCIGATTDDEYREFLESDPALKRRFHPVFVSEPSVEESVEILKGVIKSYEEHHGLRYEPAALDAAVRLAARYVPDRVLPDKAIHVADLAASRARRGGKLLVGVADVAAVVADLTRVPVELLAGDDGGRMLDAEKILAHNIVGHREVLGRVASVLRRNYAGFRSGRPIGSFLFLGPTGVGKTETARVLAEFLFRAREALCRLDMSEYAEAHTVARLIGAPPGYVGYGEGGQLTEAVRKRPYCVVLLDEVEKAHPEVLLILLQALDDGRLTDGRGRTVDLSNTLFVMTSNLGSAAYRKEGAPIGFAAESEKQAADQDAAERVVRAAKAHFPIELWNRIDEKCVFSPLDQGQVADVARLMIRASSERLGRERQVTFEASDAAIAWLIDAGAGYDPELGARPMRRAVQSQIEGPIAEMVLRDEVGEGSHVLVDRDGDRLGFTIRALEETGEA